MHKLSTEPVQDPAEFVGREREIVQLTEALAAGRSVCIVGPPGSGASSLLIHIGQTVDLTLDVPPHVVSLDLRSVRTSADFYAPILRALGHSGDDELALGQVLHPADAPPLLLLLDNLDTPGQGWSSLIRSALRGWINTNKLQLLAASNASLGQAAPDLQAVLLQVQLPPMPEREARTLITSFFERLSQPIDAADINTILAVAGGYPGRLRRAVELWIQSNGGSDFDWQRAFRQEFPQQATLADEVRGWQTQLEAEPDAVQSAVLPAEKALRRHDAKPEKPKPTYQMDDPSEFLAMLVLLALSFGVWWALGLWWGFAAFVLSLLLWIGLAHALVNYGGERYRRSLYVQATTYLPIVGRWAPRSDEGNVNS